MIEQLQSGRFSNDCWDSLVVVAVVKVIRDDDAVISVALLNTVMGCRSLDLYEKFSGAGLNCSGQSTHDGNIWLTFSGGVTTNIWNTYV